MEYGSMNLVSEKLSKYSDSKFSIIKKGQFYFLIFVIGAICGWIYEEIFYFIADGKIYNRGFLYGPYLPVYGYGAILMIMFLRKVRNNPIFVFLLAVLITGILEYFTGKIMWEIWHQKWWDYTGLFLNIDGYVCLRSVITFGIGGLFLIYVIEPFLTKMIKTISNKKINCLCIIVFAIFLIDNIITFIFRHPI